MNSPSHASDRRHLCVLALCALALSCMPSCGFGTAAVVSASSGGGGSTGQSVASALLAPRSPTSPASIFFVLTDQEGDAADVELLFRQGSGGDFRPITLGAGGAPLTRVPSSSTPYRVSWDFAADLGGEGYHKDIELQLVVKGGISPAPAKGIVQGNDAPIASAPEPFPFGAEEYVANTDVVVTVADSGSDVVRVKVEYNDDAAGGYPDTGWKIARPAATPAAESTPEFALLGVQATPAGMQATFRWDTLRDLAGFDADVRVRCTPEDEYAKGIAVTSAPFRIDNNVPPQVILDQVAVVLGTKQRGDIPLPFQVIDPDSDQVKVLAQWRVPGQDFPALPTTAASLVDLLDNPARAAERAHLQVAVEAPLAFTGRVGAHAGLAPNQVRLPELASSASGLLANGVVGRTLEILRPTTTLQSIDWTPNPLNAPVATLPSPDGSRALVLDSMGAGWRLRELDLETGAVVRQIATGVGQPKALGLDPSGAHVFVGSHAGLFRLDRWSGAAAGSVPLAFADGPRGLAAIGTNVVAATGDDKLVLVRFGPTGGAVATAINGLAEPWGVVVDPLDEGRVYLAERAADRVSTLDLDALRPRAVVAEVAPADVAALGAIPFPSPRALALEHGGTRLLVMTQFGHLASLRTLDLRSPIDFDDPRDGRADPIVREVTRQLGEPSAAVAAGPDGLRVVSLAAANRLALGGGVSQRRAIVRAPQTVGQPEPYVPSTQVVTLTTPLTVLPGAAWRIRAFASGPIGRQNTFVWDTSDVPDPALVQVRVVPLDGDVGIAGIGAQFRPFQTTFEAVTTPLPTGAAPLAVAAADLDGDGDVDLVSGDYFANALTISLQQAPGVFTPGAIVIPTGSYPTFVSAADVDGDGDVDLVSTGVGGLTVYYQSAPGVFASGVSVAPGARSVAIADLDGDGTVDLVTGGYDTLQVFFQTAPGVFTPGATSLPAGIQQFSVAAADLDGDGDLDLVAANRYSDNLTLYFQTAPRVFTPGPSALPTSIGPISVAAADLDGDGDCDLVAADRPSNSGADTGFLTLYFQTAPGVFTRGAAELTAGWNPTSVVAADLDGDGDCDLVTANISGNSLTLYYQSAPGEFVSATSGLATGGAPACVAAVDLDGDRDIDLVSANSTGSTLTLYFQSSSGGFRPGGSLPPTGYTPTSLAAADLDGDGDQDLVSAHEYSQNLTLYFQSSPGVFTPGASGLPAGYDAQSTVAADLDGDGDLDLVSVHSGALILHFQGPPGVFTPGASVLTTGLGSGSVAAADLDGDGDLDLVSTNYYGNTLTLYFQSAPGLFSPGASVLPTGSHPLAVAAADLDGDGDVDLVSADYDTSTLTLHFQSAPGVFTPGASVLPTSSGPHSVVVSDVDGDGDLDLLSVNNGTPTLYFQTAPGVFTLGASTLPTIVGPISVADCDGDGDVDLVARDSASSTLTLYLQRVPGVFTPGGSVPSTGALRSIAVADLDGDGDIDLVPATFDSIGLTLFFNGP
ncbi:MAG: VCBS repeat-containing protein [Planctomycetes bacterium]|nr:VCBS repeat-containing protein [Planctomycetota bacterium]